jgi:hypothetical protein
VKKNLLLTLFLLFAIAFFHKAIVGLAARLTIQSKTGCEMAYRSFHWEKGGLVFSDLVLFDSDFHAYVGTAAIRLDWSAFPKKLKGHIALDRPHISGLKKRTLPQLQEGWLDFSFSVSGGTIEWDGLAHFSLDQNQLAFDWEESSAQVTFIDGEIEADLKQFRAKLLKSFLPWGEVVDGCLTGRIHLGPDQTLTSANLKMEQLEIEFPLGAIESVDGSLSYHSALGAKWELRGLGFAQAKQFPFACEGRGFFKSHWLESEIQFDEAVCKISGKEKWKVECRDLHAAQATLLQACAEFFVPSLSSWSFVRGSVDGEAELFADSWSASFEGKNLSIRKGEQEFSCNGAKANLSQEGGDVTITGDAFDLACAGTWDQWKAQARIFDGRFDLRGGWDGEKCPIEIENGVWDDFRFSGRGWIDANLDFSLGFNGVVEVLQRQIPFHCPHVSKRGQEWAFDFRFARKTWDILRLVGVSNGEKVFFDSKSHLLGAALQFAQCPLGEIDVALRLPWKSILAADLLLKEWGIDVAKIPFTVDTDLHFQYKNGKPEITAEADVFKFYAVQIADEWEMDLISDLVLSASLQKDGKTKGKARWKTALEVEFDGKISPDFRCELSLPKMRADLAQLDLPKMEGILDGQGHLVYNAGLEADLDFHVSSLKIYSQPLENEGSIHLYYSSAKGTLLSGVNLHGPLDCNVDLLEFDAHASHWVFHDAQVHLPGSLLTHRFLQFLDKDHDLNFRADLDFASDLSTFACTMREGLIPLFGESRPIENLQLFVENAQDPSPKFKCKAALHYLDHLHRIHFTIDDQIEGRLILGEADCPLTIDWSYKDALSIHSMEGSFGGVEAAFHAESPNYLIGSARINFTTLSQLLPASIAEVFEEIQMGAGYELKGRLKIEKNLPYFQGILAGKQLELFSFQFRTLLAQAEISPERVHLYDLKISDTAGMMKIDELLIEGSATEPWTISIPQLTILDLRPSLLQTPGEPIGPISPLVVRELTLTNCKGLLDDGTTYTAQGKLHFINSYKREETVFDLPVNVLSRIVGIDLELLIPVCGDLDFDLSNGFFTLKELTNAYSEGQRSQFFLEMEPPPRMDLDGNLTIFVKMKQFVLLKITESFLINIEGRLNDPQVHLQKRRLFGLM